jgi:hypothetical protein
MARKSTSKAADNGAALSLQGVWNTRITEACKRYQTFHKEGDLTNARYMLEKEAANAPLPVSYWMDKYNILYSSTETMRPSLYVTTPKVEAVQRHKDRKNETALYATMLLEAVGQYGMEEVDFDEVLGNVIEDYLLPGMGQAWVRYDPEFEKDEAGNDYVSYEGLDLDYVHWKDFVTCPAATWKRKRWIAKRCYFTERTATDRFGAEKAKQLQYAYRPADIGGREGRPDYTPGMPGDEAIVWEIWDKDTREVLWFSPDANEILDRKADPLKLKNFWPCPRPLRAVSTTKRFVPKGFYSQYRAQAETLDDITMRIRILTKALRVVGVYDASLDKLQQILTGTDNKMVPVENWPQFQGNGGIAGSVVYLPIKDIAAVLTELYKQREIAKAEIYEITGFGDIMRGVSKASETLGAQEIKNNWAQGRLGNMQKEVQRFCRDIIRIMVEIMSEHFSDESLALYGGFDPPEVTPEEQQAASQYAIQVMQWQQAGGEQSGTPQPQQPPPTGRQQAIGMFKRVVELLRKEKTRCAQVGIETDSTIQPDEAQERKDRMEFLGAAGAYMQQAGPMAMQYPEMRPLLMSMLMFTVRTFRSSRPLEKDFEEFQQKFAAAPPMDPNGNKEGGEGKGDPAAAAQAKVQSEQLRVQSDQQLQQQDLQMEKYKVDQQEETKRQKQQQDHDFRMAQLEIERQKLAVQQQKNIADAGRAERQEHRADVQQDHQQGMDYDSADRADRELETAQQQRPSGED